MLSYRSSFAVPAPIDSVVPAVRQTMIRWAEGKHGRRLGQSGLDDLVAGSRLTMEGLDLRLVDTVEPSGDRLMGFLIVEGDGDESWTSNVMVAGGARTRGQAVVCVEIDAPRSPADPVRPKNSAVPRFVRTLLDTLECDDAGIHLTNVPTVLGVESVHRLLKELQEEDHHGLVLVAGTPTSFPLEHWADFVKNITYGTVGQAATYVLDAAATEAFNDAVSNGHRVAGGSLRTFVPGARFDEPADAVRHRFLTAATLADDELSRRARHVLERRARAFTNGRPLNRQVRRYQTLVARYLDELGAQSGVVESTPSAAAASRPVSAEVPGLPLSVHENEVEVAPQRFDEDVLSLRSALDAMTRRADEADAACVATRRELDEAKQRADLAERRSRVDSVRENKLIAELEFERDEVAQDRDELRLEYALVVEDKAQATERVHGLEAEVARLRRLLEKDGRGDEAWAEVDAPSHHRVPADWPELAEWAKRGQLAERLPYLDFTCNWDRAVDLDDQNEFHWVSTTWDILMALNDYARARSDASIKVLNLHGYLSGPPSGFHAVSRNKYKPTESETVANRDRYRKERTFPVPEVVPGSQHGVLYMDKHFVIAQSGMVSPRLYLYDGTGVPGYGKVVIGYIGRHLTNDQTN